MILSEALISPDSHITASNEASDNVTQIQYSTMSSLQKDGRPCNVSEYME